MERQLMQIVESLLVVSNVQNMDAVNPIVHRLSNNTIRKVTTIVAALREPSNLILPLNVIWFDYNPQSVYYKKALRRVSKEPDTVRGYTHTWEVIETMQEFNVDQAYDAEDTEALNQPSPIPLASMREMGIARLSVPPLNSTAPIVVGEGDPRLSDARTPKYHTHAEKPATMILTRGGRTIRINTDVAPVIGATIVYQGNDRAVWRQLTTSDIQQ